MITQNEIMWDGMFEELETPLNTELSEIKSHLGYEPGKLGKEKLMQV